MRYDARHYSLLHQHNAANESSLQFSNDQSALSEEPTTATVPPTPHSFSSLANIASSDIGVSATAAFVAVDGANATTRKYFIIVLH